MKTTVERLFTEQVEAAMTEIKFSDAKNQINGASGRNYTKVNQLLLISAQSENKYESNEWLSKEQAANLNLEVKKGKGTMLFNTNIKVDLENTYTDRETGEIKPYKIKSYNYYYVFNLDQLEQIEKIEEKKGA